MAKVKAVWGIDIGQCALKALRCRLGDNEGEVVADAFDYIEYPKILSQPEADPPELIREALEQFLSRNSVKEDRVAISVPGQSGLARFIKLPPVESKKVPDLVRFEAKQQIPFPLEDVVWDYQRMLGGSETDGYLIDAEVGLFAIKREQVHRALEPFKDANIEVDFVQLTPLALYNYVVFDQLRDLPPPEEYDPDNPPESVVLVSLGTDSSDVVISNGYRVWQRSVPIGGNHFTKALMKEMKITFAKAEHFKRNASQAENPRAIFQAMRPVFTDLQNELQRTINYFSNIDRKAKIGRVVCLGSAIKLPGLQKFLSQSLSLDVTRVENYSRLAGAGVVDSPLFMENTVALGVCYGLALQGLQQGTIRTNLLPQEIVKERLIRSKKPWALAAAAMLLFGASVGIMGSYRSLASVHPEKWGDDQTPGTAVKAAKDVSSESSSMTSAFSTAKSSYDATKEVGHHLVHNVEGRVLWLELLKAINLSLPTEAGALNEDITKRNEIYVTSIDCVKVEDLATGWWEENKKWYQQIDPNNPTAAEAPPAAATGTESTGTAADPAAGPAGPTGKGWVIQLRGFHYHNARFEETDEKIKQDSAAAYLRRTLVANLHRPFVPIQTQNGIDQFPVGKLGISYPMVISPGQIDYNYVPKTDLARPDSRPDRPGGGGGGGGGAGGMGPGGMGPGGMGPGGMGPGGMGAGGGGGMMPGGAGGGMMPGGAGGGMLPGGGGGGQRGPTVEPKESIPRWEFVVQFVWQEKPASVRRKEAEEELAAAAAASGQQPGTAN